jgi:hypothetical protein
MVGAPDESADGKTQPDIRLYSEPMANCKGSLGIGQANRIWEEWERF